MVQTRYWICVLLALQLPVSSANSQAAQTTNGRIGVQSSQNVQGEPVGKKTAVLSHFVFTSNTGNNATVIVLTSSNPHFSDGQSLASGDEIGVFTPGGLCCGAAIWNQANTALTAWGDDDQTPAVDGFKIGQMLLFRVWRQSTGKEYPATVQLASGPATYQVNGLSIISSFAADPLSSLKPEPGLPTECNLLQNYPNPFNPSTTIRYGLPASAFVSLKIFNMLGQLVADLVDEQQEAGYYQVRWIANVPSGVYVYRLQTGQMDRSHAGGSLVGSGQGFAESKRMILMK